MTRAKLLRLRLKALFPAACAPFLKPIKPQNSHRPEPGKLRSSQYGVALYELDRRAKWATQPDVTPTLTLRIRRTKRPLPLVEISRKSGRKLVRKWRKAEGMLGAELSGFPALV